MKIKTSELEKSALNYCVAIALGSYATANGSRDIWGCKIWSIPGFKSMRWDDWNPSTDWSLGGVLLDHYIGEFIRRPRCKPWARTNEDHGLAFANGPTLLIAACRAIVSAKLGDTVDVPEELV